MLGRGMLTVTGDARRSAEDVVQRAVEQADAIVRPTDAHLLREDVAAIDVAADSEQRGQVGAHVEQGLRAGDKLADGGDAVARDVAVVGESVQAGAGAALVGVSGCFEGVVICGGEVLMVRFLRTRRMERATYLRGTA